MTAANNNGDGDDVEERRCGEIDVGVEKRSTRRQIMWIGPTWLMDVRWRGSVKVCRKPDQPRWDDRDAR